MKVIVKRFANISSWSNKELATWLNDILGNPKSADAPVVLTKEMVSAIKNNYSKDYKVGSKSTLKKLYQDLKNAKSRPIRVIAMDLVHKDIAEYFQVGYTFDNVESLINHLNDMISKDRYGMCGFPSILSFDYGDGYERKRSDEYNKLTKGLIPNKDMFVMSFWSEHTSTCHRDYYSYIAFTPALNKDQLKLFARGLDRLTSARY